MSRTIDDRIVEMRFDNEQFESNVQTSIDTLDKLKQSLNLSGAAKGLENVEEAAKGIDMSGLSSAIQTVQSKFSAFEVVSITALANITNSAVNAGIQLVKSLSVDQITAGWNKYGKKTSSVQTIINATGKSIDEVNKYLDKLMWFSDETSYGFADMTAALAQLTSAGGDIDKLVPMITGIANATAFAGKGAAEFSRGIYNLNQSYGAGSLQYIDWRSLELAGIASKELKQTFIDTGIAMGKIKEGEVTIANFSQTLKDKWADTSVMEAAFGKFGEMTEKAYEMVQNGEVDTASEAYAILAEKYNGVAITAAKAAQEAKTFREAIDATKDAVSSGWMKTFELIFGNYEEAKVLWTDLANSMWDAFASGAEARNEMLSEWKELGGRDDLVESFWNTWEAIGSIIKPIKEAFRDIFPPMTAERLAAFTKALKEFTAKLKLSDQASENLKRTFKGLFAVLDIIKQAFSAVFKGLSPLLGKVDDLGGSILGVTAKIGDWLVKLNDTIRTTKIFEKAVQTITNVLKNFKQIVIDAFNKIKPSIISAAKSVKQFLQVVKEKFVSPGLELFHALLGRVHDRMASLSGVAEKMRDGIIHVFEAIGDALEKGSFFKFLETLWKIIVTVGSAILKIVGQLAGGLIEKIANTDFSGIIDFFNSLTLGGILVLITKFIKGFKSITKTVGTFKDSAIGILDSVRGCLESFQTKIKADTLMKIATAIAILVASILVLSLIDSKKLDASLTALAVVFGELLTSMAIFTSISGKFTGVAKACTAMISMSVAVLILAGALKSIASLDMDQILKGLLGLAGIMAIAVGALSALSKFVEKSSKTFSLSKNGIFSSKTKKNFVELGIAMIAIAASMKIFASAAKDLAELDLNGLAKGIAGIGVVLGEVVGFIALVKVIKPEKMISTSISLIAIAASMKIFASAAKDFADMNWEDLGKAGAAIAGILLVVASFSKLIGKSEKVFSISKDGLLSKQSSQSLLSISVALIAMGAAMKIFASAAKSFAEMSWEDLGKAGAAIAGILLSIGGFMRIMPSSAHMISTGAGLVIMAASMKIFASVVKDFADMSWEGLSKAGSAMAGILFIIGAFTKIIGGSSSIFMKDKDGFFSSRASNGLLKTSASLLVLSVSMKIFASVMKSLASLSWEGIAKGLIYIAGAFTVIGIAGYVLAPIIPAILGLAGALTLIGIGILAAGTGLLAFGLGLTAVSAGVTTLAGSLTLVISSLVAIVKGVIVGIIEAIGEGFIKLCEIIAGSASAIGNAVKTVVLTVIDVLVECIPPLVDGTLKLIAGLLSALVDYTPQIVDSLFQFIIKIIEGIGTNTPKLIQAIVDMLMNLFQGAIDALMSIDPEVFIEGALAITAIAGMMAALSAVAALVPAAMVGALGVIAVLAEFGALAQLPGLAWLIGEGKELFQAIGEVIGGLVGGIVGGFMGGVSNSFPIIATNLSAFMTNLQPFLEGAKNIDQSILSGVNALVGTILAITGASLLERITSWITGGSSLAKFGEEIAAFGPMLKEYSDAVVGINPEAVQASASAAKALAEMASMIPNEGGVASWFAGENSVARFGSKLSDLGDGLKGFSDSVSGIVPENIIAASNAAKALAEMASTIPNEGGVTSWFAGENSVARFGSQLSDLGDGLKGFSDSVSGIVPENLVSVSNAAKALAEMTATIPNEGGVASWFAGENSVARFGNQLSDLGDGLKGFSDSVYGIVPENLVAVSNAAKALAEMTATIPNEGGVKAWFSGKSGVVTFSDNLPDLGDGLKGFSDSVSGIVPENIIAASNAAKALAEMTAIVPKNTNKILSFGTNLENFGTKLASYFEETKTISSESISGANEIIKFIKDISNINSNNIKAVSKAIDDIIKSVKGMSKITEASATNFKNALNEVGKIGSEALLNPFENIKSDMEKAGKNAINAFIDGVKSKKYSVESAAKEIANRSKEEIESKRSSFNTAGRYLVEGFAEGIEENTYKAEARAEAMAQAAADAAKAILKEHSPSKVGYNIGDFFGIAFVNAIGDYKDKAYNTSAEVAGSAKSGLRDSLNKIKDIIDGNIDTQPSIRPVLDLSDVRAGAAAIGGMLNMNSQVGILANVRGISNMMNNQNRSGDDVVSAIKDLSSKLDNRSGDTYTVNGITYDDGSNIADAVKSLVRAARVERRT